MAVCSVVSNNPTPTAFWIPKKQGGYVNETFLDTFGLDGATQAFSVYQDIDMPEGCTNTTAHVTDVSYITGVDNFQDCLKACAWENGGGLNCNGFAYNDTQCWLKTGLNESTSLRRHAEGYFSGVLHLLAYNLD